MSQSPTPEQILAVLQTAQQAAMKQDYANALTKYRWVEQNILDDEDNLPLLRIEIAWAYYHMQQYPHTIAYLEKAMESPVLNPHQVFDALRLIGVSYSMLRNPGKAIANLEDATLQPIPDYDKRYAYFEIGKIYFAANDTKKARPPLEKVLPLFKDDDQEYRQTTRYYLGMIHFFEKNMTAAESYFLDFIKQTPTEKAKAPGLFGMAHLMYERKEYEKLQTTCQKVMELDPDFFDKETIGFFLCISYLGQRKWTESRQVFDQLKSAYPDGKYAVEYPAIEKKLTKKSNKA